MASLNSNDIKVRMEKALDALKKDLSSLRVGRASSTMLDTINVNAYGSIMPVSYTHLRAHETKANLVCRLLLEKKNNLQNKKSKVATLNATHKQPTANTR